MSGHSRWLRTWSRTVGMPLGVTDDDKPEFLPITQTSVKRALGFRTFWIVMHVVTCFFIIAAAGRTLDFW